MASRRSLPSPVLGASLALALLAACGPSVQTAPTPPVTPPVPERPVVQRPTVRPDATFQLPPATALQRRLMPLHPTGVPAFRQAHPTWDGRGVLIAILDSGIDPYVDGLQTTSTGGPKLVDLRDFSGEGRVALTKVTPDGDAVTVGGKVLNGFGRLRGQNGNGPWYAGTLREIPLGEAPASDVNWNNSVGDTLAVLVTRANDGWILLADFDGDGTLANEKPVHDYLVAQERFGWAPAGRAPMLGFVANFGDRGGEPVLDLYFDNSGHGTHVAGIASGHRIYGVDGFDGVAPGAEVLGLKISNDAQGGITTTGSMLLALDYAIRRAAERKQPLVVNMSFGVGNELEGGAVVDRLIDSVLAAHPDILFAISAGNDGPGGSTLGFPGSADRILSVGATFPRVFISRDPDAATDPIAYFSSRGGEVARPDLLTPGVAFSTKPNWARGSEVDGGTSMASPHAAGLAALLVSGLTQSNKPVVAARVKQALVTTAQPVDGLTALDQGTGVPDVGRAWRWLETDRRWAPVTARASGEVARGSNAAFRPTGLRSAGDTTQAFTLTRTDGATAPVELTLRSDAAWLVAPAKVTLRGPATTVTLRYRASALTQPGRYVGTVTVWGSDSTAGPVARLVNGVVVPVPAALPFEAPVAAIGAGLERRWSFGTEPHRPFEARAATGAARDLITAFLHEPGGQPFRAGHEHEGANGEDAAVFRVDARDVVGGVYEVVVAAPPASASTGGIRITQSPVSMIGSISGTDPLLALRNLTAAPVSLAASAATVGAVRLETLSGAGADTGRLSFELPEWVRRVEVDVQMAADEWVKFTDFGVTLEDASGVQLGQGPLNYAFGRLDADLPVKFTGTTAALRLYPAWTKPGSAERWTTTIQIRLYADPTTESPLAAKGSATVTIPAGTPESVGFATGAAPWPLPQGFLPLIRYAAKVGDEDPWTAEAPLAAAPTPLMR
jgi:subtilisin family serine protease